jgi:hypothetical protein
MAGEDTGAFHDIRYLTIKYEYDLLTVTTEQRSGIMAVVGYYSLTTRVVQSTMAFALQGH